MFYTNLKLTIVKIQIEYKISTKDLKKFEQIAEKSLKKEIKINSVKFHQILSHRIINAIICNNKSIANFSVTCKVNFVVAPADRATDLNSSNGSLRDRFPTSSTARAQHRNAEYRSEMKVM